MTDPDKHDVIIARLEATEHLDPALWNDAIRTLGIDPYDQDGSSHFVAVGAWTDACLALIERVLPGAVYLINKNEDTHIFYATLHVKNGVVNYLYPGVSPVSLPLALLLATFKALQAQEQV